MTARQTWTFGMSASTRYLRGTKKSSSRRGDRTTVIDNPIQAPINFLAWPQLADEDISAVVDVLKSSKLSQLSSQAVAQFEDSLATFVGRQYAVAVNSGTAALHTALAALDIGAGDEVVVPSHTFIGSASPIIHQKAKPVFADVDDQSYCLCPESLRASITSRTKAIIAVHLNGAAAPMDEITSIADDHGIPRSEE